MTGIFPTKARMQKRLATLGYNEVESNSEARWLLVLTIARGHAFRYSSIDPMPDRISRVYQSPAEAYQVQSTVATYFHLHFLSSPAFAKAFVERCRDVKNSK